MNTEKWNTKKQLIVNYVQNNDVGGFAPIIMGTVALVDEAQTDESRQTLVESIRAIFKTIDPNKVSGAFRTGKQPTLPASVLSVLMTIMATVKTNLQDLFNSDHMANLLIPHGKSKDMGDLFSDDEQYAQYESKRIEARLNKWYRSKIWDGTLEGLQTLNFTSMEVEEEE
jgi:hypothetical protein